MITSADAAQISTIKNTQWYETSQSGDITTYDPNTLDSHVSVS